MSKPLSKAKIRTFFKHLEAANPEPETELNYGSPFELLIAVILSAQSTDIGVNKATDKLYAVANTPAKILQLGEEGLKRYISSLGLYNNKAKNIIATCEILQRDFNGEVPCDRKALESLPGVGRKTANVVLNVLFGQPTVAVDTHIFRVANRTGLACGKTPRQVEDGLMKAIPKSYLRHAHHWLVLHGRYICTARKPKCAECPVINECNWPDKPLPVR